MCDIVLVAVENGRLDVAKVLTNKLLCSSNSPGYTELHAACEKGQVEVVRSLLQSQEYKGNIYCCTVGGITPLHVACVKGHLEVVQRLLKSFNHPNVPSAHNITPLHLACIQDHEHVVKFLLSNKECDVTVQTSNGFTPLQIVRFSNNTRLLRLLKDRVVESPETKINHNRNRRQKSIPLNEDGDLLLHLACGWGRTDVVEYLADDEQCDINAKNIHGNTPLHTACYAGVTEVIRVLLSKRCNTRIINSRNHTPQFISTNPDGDLLLHLACQWGDVDIVRYLVNDQHCDINTTNNLGNTPLHTACYTGCTQVIRILLSKRSKTQIANRRSHTPQFISTNPDGDLLLHLACQWGDVDIVEYLVNDQQCDVKAVNNHGDIPLHTAALHNKPAIVRYLINSGCNPDTRNNFGDTPLHIACCKQSIEAIKSLLLFKATTKTVNAKGDTPQTIPLNEDGDLLLHQACQWGDSDIVKYLVNDQKCDVKVVNKHGSTALHKAACHNKPLTVHFLITSGFNPDTRNNSGDTPLHTACYEQSFKAVRSLLLLKSNTIKKNAKGDTPQTIPLNEDGDLLLHLACQWGDKNIVEYLVNDEQCDVNARSIHGNTPLHTAVTHGHDEIVGALLNHEGCNPNLTNHQQETPLHVSVRQRDVKITNLLIGKCNANTINDRGDTPLHIAANMGSVEICKLLLQDKKCDPNIQNTSQNTPLHIAVVQGKLEIVKALAEDATCNLNLRNSNEFAPLHIAISCNEQKIARSLINNRGCDPTVPDHDGNTPLHLACKYSPEMTGIAYLLLLQASVDPNHVNNDGQTPVELTTSYELIQKINYFNECKNEHSVETYIKVFILGNPETGKSTLVKAICREATKWLRLLPPSLRRVRNVPAHTAGIIPTTFRSKKFGNTVLYDLAGQYEYYSSHAAVIETSVRSSPPAFLVVINLSESHDEIMRKVKYWWSFIDNHAVRSSAPPHVILIGSHADIVKSRGEKAKEKLAQILIAVRKISSSFYCAGEVALDCRNPTSKGLNRLCSQLDQSCSVLRQSVDVDLHCHVMYAFLQTDLFHGQVACTISDIAAHIRDEDVLLPHDPTDLVKLFCSLSDRGLVLLVEAKNKEESWVVLQRQTLLSEINGTIFAPQTFRQHQHFSRSTGVVPFSKLMQAFPQYHPDLIAGFLTHLEFCFKIDDMETLRRIEDEARSVGGTSTDLDPSDEYYFFPALVSVENPLQVWQPDDSMTYQCGWYYHCTHPDQFLTTRFLQVLILRLAFTFALAIDPHHCPQDDVPVLCRRCSVWKHGIGWLNRAGIETVVEVGLQCRWVSVMMRCSETVEIKCVQLRSAVINKIMTTQCELCPRVKMSESLIHSSEIKYPFTSSKELKLYSLTDIARSIKEREPRVLDQDGRNPVLIEQLLYFEPYVGVRKEVLEVLFRPENRDTRVPEEVLSQLAEDVYPRMELYREAIQPAAMSFHEELHNEPIVPRQCLSLFCALHRRINPTYENFHKELDQFSIFHGRNPMVSMIAAMCVHQQRFI